MRTRFRSPHLAFATVVLGLVFLFAQSSESAYAADNVLDATKYSGSDPCAQVNAAIQALPESGGAVDATGFTEAQLEIPCLVSINVIVPARILFGFPTWHLYGNPGINILAGKVTIECPESSFGDLYQTYPPNFESGAPYPLISDTVQDFHATDGFVIRNCYLNGKNVGTFGLFFPYGNSGQIYKTFTSNFTSVGQFTIGGQWVAESAYSCINGGDGVVWGYDGSVDGNAQYCGNGGNGFHVVAGGSTLRNQGTYHNRLNGFYIDGTGSPDWPASTTYIEQHFIRPTSGNLGDFAYFTQVVGTTSASRPTFCQTPGCTILDNGVTWINVGVAREYENMSTFADNLFTTLEASTCGDEGWDAPQGYMADGIRVEGYAGNPYKNVFISDAGCHQTEANTYFANAIHLKYVDRATISGFEWWGPEWSGILGGAGLIVEGSTGVTLSNMVSYYSNSNALRVVNSSDSIFSGIVATDTGVPSSPRNDKYAVLIDAPSKRITLNGVTVEDDRTPPYSYGIYDDGWGTEISNYQEHNLAVAPPQLHPPRHPGGSKHDTFPQASMAAEGPSSSASLAIVTQEAAATDSPSSVTVQAGTSDTSATPNPPWDTDRATIGARRLIRQEKLTFVVTHDSPQESPNEAADTRMVATLTPAAPKPRKYPEPTLTLKTARRKALATNSGPSIQRRRQRRQQPSSRQTERRLPDNQLRLAPAHAKVDNRKYVL